MCGIAGYIGTGDVPRERVRRCLSLMRHRGPDARGFYEHEGSGGKVLLLHARLSIIDLDRRSDQPFQKGGAVTVFNGELYNYVEIRKRLESRGHTFCTDSDTEVLHELLRDGDSGGLDVCEGMWAFAHYREDDGKLMLCRDRFSEKPLYIHKDESGVYFGSEIKFLMALSGKSFTPDPEYLQRFLVYGYRTLYKYGRTPFAEVSEVPARSFMELSAGRVLRLETYWEPRLSVDETMTCADAVEGARDALLKAVKIRLRSDVPVSFSLSGGIDSNAVASIAARLHGMEVNGFTVVSEDVRYDEWDMVKTSINALGINHVAVPLSTEGFLDNLARMVEYHDSPVYTLSSYVHWLLMHFVAERGYKVLLSGAGADELFTGYYDHHLFYLAELERESDQFRKSYKNWLKHVAHITRNPFLQDFDAFVASLGRYDHLYPEWEKYARLMLVEVPYAHKDKQYVPGILRNRMVNEMFEEVIPVILHEDDLNSMQFSIENRSPFLDRNLFEFCNSIPTRHLIRDGLAKSVLRDAMAGIVPDEILQCRRKVGFNAPIEEILQLDSPKVREAILDGSAIYDMVDKTGIEMLMNKRNFQNSDSKFIFSFLSCKFFIEQHSAR